MRTGYALCQPPRLFPGYRPQGPGSGFDGPAPPLPGLAYGHGNIPGHVHVGLEAVHPHLGRPQGVALGVVIDVIVVGLLGAFDVCHTGAGQHLHAAPALPHLPGTVAPLGGPLRPSTPTLHPIPLTDPRTHLLGHQEAWCLWARPGDTSGNAAMAGGQVHQSLDKAASPFWGPPHIHAMLAPCQEAWPKKVHVHHQPLNKPTI